MTNEQIFVDVSNICLVESNIRQLFDKYLHVCQIVAEWEQIFDKYLTNQTNICSKYLFGKTTIWQIFVCLSNTCQIFVLIKQLCDKHAHICQTVALSQQTLDFTKQIFETKTNMRCSVNYLSNICLH